MRETHKSKKKKSERKQAALATAFLAAFTAAAAAIQPAVAKHPLRPIPAGPDLLGLQADLLQLLPCLGGRPWISLLPYAVVFTIMIIRRHGGEG